MASAARPARFSFGQLFVPLLSAAVLLINQFMSIALAAPPSIDPADTDAAWHIPVEKHVSDSAPQHSDHRKLQGAFERYRDMLKSGGWDRIDPGSPLHIGDRDPRVVAIRKRLRMTGDFTALVEADSFFFDTGIDAAVRRFQTRHRLRVNGVVDEQTRAAMNVTVEERLVQLAVARQRWRWLPKQLGPDYIWVNVPESKLVLVTGGKEALSMRVIVGHPERPTPSFQSSLHQIVFNPSWSVPRTIAVQDLLPQQQRNPDFLSRNGIRVFRGWSDAAKEIPAEKIDWSGLSSNFFPYRFVQDPGPTNSLGRVKLVMDNPFDIYLHDSPAWRLFYLSSRTLSSGCVRLSDAPAFVHALTSRDQGWSKADVAEHLRPAPTGHVNLDHPVPIYIVYFTSWVGEDQQVYFARDVYGRDEQLAGALIRTELAELLRHIERSPSDERQINDVAAQGADRDSMRLDAAARIFQRIDWQLQPPRIVSPPP